MKNINILLGTIILLAGSMTALRVAAYAQEPQPTSPDDPSPDWVDDPRNNVNEVLGVVGRAVSREDYEGGLLPGGVKIAPCVKPVFVGWKAGVGPQFGSYYCDVTNPRYRSQQVEMRKEMVLESIASGLNSIFRIPKSVALTYRECSQANAFYTSAPRQITMCYELVDEFYKTYQKDGLKGDELDRAVGNAVTFAFYHELGHALVNVLDLPITGKEEDAVDQLATFIVADGADADETTALDGAIAFLLMAKNAKGQQTPFWDQHSLGEQRFYSIICSLYGDAPDKYKSVVTEGLLPKDRAARCIPEWKKIERSWGRLLAPFIRKQ
jgi:hypothetical protein